MRNAEPMKFHDDSHAFLASKMSRSIPRIQSIREIYHNAQQAVQRVGGGDIIWTRCKYHWKRGFSKLCCIDTGDGIPRDALRTLNVLGKSSSKQGYRDNFGVGCRLASLRYNSAGMIFVSKVAGCDHVYMVHLTMRLDENDQERMEMMRWPETDELVAEAPDDIVPDEIIKAGHGTKVILLGNSVEEDTMRMDSKEVRSGGRWIACHLNTRYYRIDPSVSAKAPDQWENPDAPRSIRGALEGELIPHSESRGTVDVAGHVKANVHWFIKKVNPRTDKGRQAYQETRYFTAVLFQNELYNIKTATSARRDIQAAGISLGYDRVVLIFEPESTVVEPDLTRQCIHVSKSGEQVNTQEWIDDFREKLPNELRALKDEFSQPEDEDWSKLLQDFMRDSANLFAANPNGSETAVLCETGKTNVGILLDSPVTCGPGGGGGGSGGGGDDEKKPRRPRTGGVVVPKTEIRHVTGTRRPLNMRVQWVSANRTPPTRAEGEMEDRAATFISATTTLQFNEDWKHFQKLVTTWMDTHPQEAEAVTPDVVWKAMKKAVVVQVGQMIINLLMVARTSDNWSEADTETALSECALTAMCSAFHTIDSRMSNALGKITGGLKKARVEA